MLVSNLAPGAKTSFKRLAPFVKVLGSVSALALVIYWIEPHNLLGALQQAKPTYLVATLCVILAAQLLSSYKWMLIVRSVGGEFRVFSAVRIYFIGMFLNNFLPSGLGGDASRVLMAARVANISLVHSTWTVIFDRATGLLALAAISYVAAGWYFFGALGVIVSLVSMLAGCLGLLAIRGHIENLMSMLPLGRQLRLPLDSLTSRALPPIAGLSFAFNGLMITSVYLVTLGFGVSVDLSYIALTAFVMTISLFLPIFVGGFGAREAASVTMLGFVGVGGGEAAAIGLTLGLLASTASLGGAVMFLFDGKRSSKRPASIPNSRQTGA